MDEVDRDLEKAEQLAGPDRFPPYKIEHQDGVHRTTTGTSGTTSTSATSVIREEMGLSRGESTGISRQTTDNMSRINTRDLERHPTALSRIHTHRSQHLGTVGRTGTTATRDSKRPLPEFGAGKPYPPPLPHQEEYVVEFDGPHDPLHPQNWPIRKKYVYESRYCLEKVLTRLVGYSQLSCSGLPLSYRPSQAVSSRLPHKQLRDHSTSPTRLVFWGSPSTF